MSNARSRELLTGMMSNSGGDPSINRALQKQIDALDRLSLGTSGSSNRAPTTRVYQRTEFRQTSSQSPTTDDWDSEGFPAFRSISQGQSRSAFSDQGTFGLHQRTISRSPPGSGLSSLNGSRLGQDRGALSDRRQFSSRQQSAQSSSCGLQPESDPFEGFGTGEAWNRLRSHGDGFSNAESPSVWEFRSSTHEVPQQRLGQGSWGPAETARNTMDMSPGWPGSNPRAQNITLHSRAIPSSGSAPLTATNPPKTASPSKTSSQVSEAKCIHIYVSHDVPAKRLKRPVQIVLTITPVDQSKLFVSQTPIAWRVFTFNPQSASEEKCTWHPSIGFSTLKLDDSNVVTADLGTHVTLRSWVKFQSSGGSFEWSTSQTLDNSPAEVVVARNSASGTRSFALCSVKGAAGEDNWKFEPFVHFKGIKKGSDVNVGAPVMLQAYNVSGYKEFQLLSEDDRDRFILSSFDGKPQPIDLRTLEEESSFCLYTDHKGKIVLKLDE